MDLWHLSPLGSMWALCCSCFDLVLFALSFHVDYRWSSDYKQLLLCCLKTARLYTYIHTYIHTYVHIYTGIYIQRCVNCGGGLVDKWTTNVWHADNRCSDVSCYRLHTLSLSSPFSLSLSLWSKVNRNSGSSIMHLPAAWCSCTALTF